MTHDVDFVVELSGRDVAALLAQFRPPEFYLDERAIHEAMRQSGRDAMFNLLHTESGDKADFWLLSESAFDQSRFSRRQLVDVEGIRFWVSGPEDTILEKLRWAKESGGSEKQITDALRVYAAQRATLDQSYLDRWASRLGVADLLKRIRATAAGAGAP